MSLEKMPYMLIMPSGKCRSFYMKGIAEMFKEVDGGTLICSDDVQPPRKNQSVTPVDINVEMPYNGGIG